MKKAETRTCEVLQIYGEDVERLIAKDDKPLPAGEAKKEDEKIQKLIDDVMANPKRHAANGWRKKKRIAKKTANLCLRLRMLSTSGWWAQRWSTGAIRG